jgi:hypothetical protein
MIGTALATIATLIVVSFATLGVGVWHAFADSMNFTQTVVIERKSSRFFQRCGCGVRASS